MAEMAVRIIIRAWVIRRVVERIPFLDHRVAVGSGRLKVVQLRGVGKQGGLRRISDLADVQWRHIRLRRKESVVAETEDDVGGFQFEARHRRAERKALTGGLPGKCAAVEAQFAALDDLIVQFKGTDAGNSFVAAWFNSRHVVDTGHRFEKPAPPAPTPSAK